METVGERIKKIRKDRKLTQKAFAEQLKMSENYIWQIEKGDREPSDKVLRLICSIYNVDEIWLQTGTGDMDAPKTRREELQNYSPFAVYAAEPGSRLFAYKRGSLLVALNPSGEKLTLTLDGQYRSLLTQGTAALEGSALTLGAQSFVVLEPLA